MRVVILFIISFLLDSLLNLSIYCNAAIVIWLWYMWRFIDNINCCIAFREFILVLYGVNYLLSPAILYQFQEEVYSFYRMKLTSEEYFTIAIPSMIFLSLGLYSIRTPVFKPKFDLLQVHVSSNSSILKQWFFIGLILNLALDQFSSELAFFIYLLSSVRYVAAISLFIVDKKRNFWYLGVLIVVEFLIALNKGLFHDLVMWLIFLALLFFYVFKPSKSIKILIGAIAIIGIFLLQLAKTDYRSRTWRGNEEAGIETFQGALEKNILNEKGVFNLANTASALTRVNQAWIFASTVNKMNQTNDYQGLSLLGKYAEAAFLPRFLAPNKLQSGDKTIFNRFSGHTISGGTSMALGFFADGYVSYGTNGAYIFAFILGLIFATIFKIVEKWSHLSLTCVFFVFPILNYAVRPDSDTQTILGHIVKAIFLFGLVIWYYKGYFLRNQKESSKHQVVKNTSFSLKLD